MHFTFFDCVPLSKTEVDF